MSKTHWLGRYKNQLQNFSLSEAAENRKPEFLGFWPQKVLTCLQLTLLWKYLIDFFRSDYVTWTYFTKDLTSNKSFIDKFHGTRYESRKVWGGSHELRVTTALMSLEPSKSLARIAPTGKKWRSKNRETTGSVFDCWIAICTCFQKFIMPSKTQIKCYKL